MDVPAKEPRCQGSGNAPCPVTKDFSTFPAVVIRGIAYHSGEMAGNSSLQVRRERSVPVVSPVSLGYGFPQCPGRVVDILEACGAFDPGSSPGRGVLF